MIGKQTASGKWPVFVYVPKKSRHPRAGKKVYVGQRPTKRGPGSARELELEKIAEFTGQPIQQEAWTCAEYAERWLERKHGQGTRRPSPATRQQNTAMLKPFLARFGNRPVDAGIRNTEALDWAADHPANAKSVAAMFNDAIRDDITKTNPFANRRLPAKRGRRDIAPLTEAEVATLADLAVTAWQGPYGNVVAGWITFLAWTGCRPGEAASRTWDDLDIPNGLVTVPRIKGDKQTDEVVLPPGAVAALERMPVQRAASESDARLLFLTARGKPYTIGSYGYYWSPVRAAFLATLDPARRKELLAVKGSLDVYALRHACASIMASRGANEFDISAQLGNSPEVCRNTYIHTYRAQTNARNAGFLSDNVRSLDERRKKDA